MRIEEKLSIKILYIPLFIILLIFTNCGGNNQKSNSDSKNDPVSAKKEFTMVSIPSELTAPKDRAHYLVSHYWDHFDFTDTTYMHTPEITEQAFANYVEILPHTQKETAYLSIKKMLTKAENDKNGKMYPYFLELFKKYLYDPNSPLRNEEYYIPVAEYIIENKISNDTDKERAMFDLNLMKKNRIGEKATDITYILASGKNGSLYNIKANYTLLYFYNPDCRACEELINYMKYSSVINALTQNGMMKVLAVYPDKDISIWQKHLKDIPEKWINGYDKNTIIKDKLLYDLKAIPTIYLLDNNKHVILKDAQIQKVEEYLKENNTMLIN